VGREFKVDLVLDRSHQPRQPALAGLLCLGMGIGRCRLFFLSSIVMPDLSGIATWTQLRKKTDALPVLMPLGQPEEALERCLRWIDPEALPESGTYRASRVALELDET
jgi:hypothetical protein